MLNRLKRPRAAISGLLSASVLLAPLTAQALLVQPVMIQMESSGTSASAAITVVNDRDRPDTVELTLSSLTLPQQGPPVLTPDPGDDFLIFPPIATIQPGKTQVFRIRWVGEPVLPQARAYMITTTEVPLDEKKGSGVQLVYAIQSLVTVTSPKLRSEISVGTVSRGERTLPGDDGQPARTVTGLNVSFDNKGEDVSFLSQYAMRLQIAAPAGSTAKSWSLSLPATDVAKYVGLGLLVPNAQRELFLAIPGVPASGDIQITLKIDNLSQ